MVMNFVRRSQTVSIAAIAVGAALALAPIAAAAPAGFPDVESYPTVDAAGYVVRGAHPSSSGWGFTTASGWVCEDSLIAEIGVLCRVPATGPDATRTIASASVSSAGQIGQDTTSVGDETFPLLPTGSSIATDNGVTCAALSDESLACRATIPASWGPDVENPPDRVYGEHGFVLAPTGTSMTF